MLKHNRRDNFRQGGGGVKSLSATTKKTSYLKMTF